MTETLDSGENCRLNLSKPIDGLNKTGYLLRLDRGSSTELKNIDTFTQYTLRNLQDFYDAFSIADGPMFLPEQDRVIIW